VSPDASKAKAELKKLLADLDPWRVRRAPAVRWPREFLVGPVCRASRGRTLFPSYTPLPEVHRSAACGEPIDPRAGWLSFPEPPDPALTALLDRIGKMRRARKHWKTVAKALNAEGVTPPPP
jgi:hypothetical protein